MQLAIEILLAILILLLGTAFWGIVKKRSLLRAKLGDRAFLFDLFSSLQERESFDDRAAKIVTIEEGYEEYIEAFRRAQERADKRIKYTALIVAILVIGASYFIGLRELIINGALFAATVFVPVGRGGRRNAINIIYQYALLLYKWRRRNETNARRYVSSRPELIEVYEVVTTVGE